MIIYVCSFCGVTTKHDHDGNGCHYCLKGAMRKMDYKMIMKIEDREKAIECFNEAHGIKKENEK